MDASTMKTAALGPSLHWYNEIDRYRRCSSSPANGPSPTLRSAHPAVPSLAVSAAMLLRKGES